jgi:transposase
MKGAAGAGCRGMSRLTLSLTQEERQELEARVRAPATGRKERERCQAVLASDAGVEQRDIAHALGCALRSVQRHVSRFRRRGLEGMRPRKAPGKPAHIPAQLQSELLRWIGAGPAAVGAPWAVWTHAHLAEHLRRVHGVRVARSTMGDWCRAHGVAPHRPSHRYLRADAAALEAARAQLAQKKRPPRVAS